jgi:2'-hydroxyisoflavone reductase
LVRVLVIGGTQFVGRHIVEAAIAAGDQVTLFHRGLTNPGLFPQAEHRLGDRDGDLSALGAGEWGATIDCSAYYPRQVVRLAEALGGRGGRYVHISSVSAYRDDVPFGFSEDAPLATLEDPTTEELTEDTYGGLKALCELAAHQQFGAAAKQQGRSGPGAVAVCVVRPTYVVGPFDHTGRFTWWVERIARGGRVLAPGPAGNPFQIIDARDLAAFVVRLSHGGASGSFHTCWPTPPFSFGEFLQLLVEVVGPPGCELVWADSARLTAAGLTQRELPLWAGSGPGLNLMAADPSRALAAGLAPRPLAETVRQTHRHQQDQPIPLPVGLAPEREEELLALLA